MEGSRLLWKLYAGAIGAVAALAVNKALTAAWRAATGSEPPVSDDPDARAREVVLWAAASATGIAIATVAVNRFAASSWERVIGSPAPVRAKRS
ncbi:MAG: DUF4235 domain-containing protein [Actinobacteria bacterium]|nr:DUF4235 domain-containing protein [Actinomycetota bacterium]